MLESIRHWLLAARPKTLPAAVVPVWIGTVLADRLLGDGGIKPVLAWCTLLSAVAIQVATNFFNDALDAEKGADTERRLGPQRASASGLIGAPVMLRAACIALVVAVALSLPMVLARGLPIIAIGLCSMICAYAYTGGPFPLAYRGMGEIFVIFFFGIVAVAGTVYVQTGTLEAVGILVGIQVGLYSSVLIAINNLRDQAEDECSRKFTLAVLFGQTFAEVEIAVFCLLPLLLGGIWFAFGQLWGQAAIFPLALLPLSAAIIAGVWGNVPGRIYNRFLAMSAAQLVGFAILFTLAAN
ncbi:MAG: 1,4-dihydroxy-2-naphthoate octaprenyltransferase [Verrucomicrobiales bacterium]